MGRQNARERQALIDIVRKGEDCARYGSYLEPSFVRALRPTLFSSMNSGAFRNNLAAIRNNLGHIYGSISLHILLLTLTFS